MDYLTNILDWLEIAKPEWFEENNNIKDGNLKNFLLSLIEEEKEELDLAFKNQDKIEILDACVDIIWMVMNSVAAMGIAKEEFEQFAQLVSVSNWSKYCNNEGEAEYTCNLYKAGKHPDKIGTKIECYYKEINGKYIIFRTSDDKILKSFKYKSITELW